jgi:Flp pilus assembly protein TadG
VLLTGHAPLPIIDLDDAWAPETVPIAILERAMKTISRQINIIAGRFRARSRELARGESSGQALVEFALISPLVLMLGLGIAIFGIGLNQDLVLTNATQIAAQQLAISRGQTTNPCATVESNFVNAAPNLTAANLTFTLTVNGATTGPTTGASNFTCSGDASDMVEGANESVTVSYPFTASFIQFGTKSYTLSSTVQEVIE